MKEIDEEPNETIKLGDIVEYTHKDSRFSGVGYVTELNQKGFCVVWISRAEEKETRFWFADLNQAGLKSFGFRVISKDAGLYFPLEI